jgi:hypothetical protein
VPPPGPGRQFAHVSRVVTVRAGKSYADGMEERLAQIRQNRIDKFNQKKALREAVSSLLPALAKIACMRDEGQMLIASAGSM